MEIDNSFDVPVPVPEAWALLMDIERITPCVPGAELTEIVDDRTYKGKIAVRLGPVSLTFAGQAHFEEMDEANYTARLKAQGTDARGRGGAVADVTFRIEAAEGGARVLIHTEVQLSGAVAQYGRGAGMVADLAQHLIGGGPTSALMPAETPQEADTRRFLLAQHLIGQFADCLKSRLLAPAEAGGEAEAEAAEATPGGPAAPVQVGGLGLKILWNALVRGLKRLFGGG